MQRRFQGMSKGRTRVTLQAFELYILGRIKDAPKEREQAERAVSFIHSNYIVIVNVGVAAGVALLTYRLLRSRR